MATRISVQNNTTVPVAVRPSLVHGHLVAGDVLRPGITVAPASRSEVGRLRRWWRAARSSPVEIAVALGPEPAASTVRILRDRGRWRSALLQSVAGQDWRDDRELASQRVSLDGFPVEIGCRATFSGGDDDVEIVVNEVAPEPSDDPDVLDLLAWNTWLRPPVFRNAQARRAALMPAPLRGHDVVVLSELFHGRIGPRLLEQLADDYPHRTPILGRTSAPRPLGPGLKMWNGGVAIASRWPLLRVETRSFRGLLGPLDMYSDKGVVYACVDKLGRRFHIFGTHAQADPEPIIRPIYRVRGRDPDAAFAGHRAANFTAIRRFVEDLAIPPGEPVLIAGDLNTDRMGRPDEHDGMLELLVAAGAEAPAHHPPTFCTVTNRLASGPAPQWLDYLLWSRTHLAPAAPEIEVRLMRAPDGWRPHAFARRRWNLSDHYALRGRFRFDGLHGTPGASTPADERIPSAGS